MSFSEYLDWLEKNSGLFAEEVESNRENCSDNTDQLKF